MAQLIPAEHPSYIEDITNAVPPHFPSVVDSSDVYEYFPRKFHVYGVCVGHCNETSQHRSALFMSHQSSNMENHPARVDQVVMVRHRRFVFHLLGAKIEFQL